jgi:elongation factor G
MTQPFDPVVAIKVAPRDPFDRERLASALAALASADPSLRISTDPATGEATIGGMGEAHLEAAIDILRRSRAIEVEVGPPQVAFRETVSGQALVDYTHKSHIGGTGQFARVKLSVGPNKRGDGLTFTSRIVAAALPETCLAGVEAGIASALGAGVVAGFPVVDIRVALVDGACHETDSSAAAFEIASRAALREALQKGGSVLLEPIMTVRVVTPEEFLPSIVRDLVARRGQIEGEERRGDALIVRASVPMVNLFGYVSQLRDLTRGRGGFDTMPAGYRIVPPDVDPDGRPPIDAALRA